MFIFKKSGALAFAAIALLVAGLIILCLRPAASDALARRAGLVSSRMSAFPKIFLWAWERPEHLEFINPQETGVAFLAETLYLRGERVVKRPRLQPLKVPTGTTLIAVVRIESVREDPPALSATQRTAVAEDLAQVADRPNIAALQIDFDATQSEREFYRDLLHDLRSRMPEAMPLSITALASWCIHDNWLKDLPIDEAVPMLFRMGVDEHSVENYLSAGGSFRATLCRESVGVSTDEEIASLPSASRRYIFSPQPWSESSARRALERSLNEKLIP